MCSCDCNSTRDSTVDHDHINCSLGGSWLTSSWFRSAFSFFFKMVIVFCSHIVHFSPEPSQLSSSIPLFHTFEGHLNYHDIVFRPKNSSEFIWEHLTFQNFLGAGSDLHRGQRVHGPGPWGARGPFRKETYFIKLEAPGTDWAYGH